MYITYMAIIIILYLVSSPCCIPWANWTAYCELRYVSIITNTFCNPYVCIHLSVHTFSRCLLAPPPARVTKDVDVGSEEGETRLSHVVHCPCLSRNHLSHCTDQRPDTYRITYMDMGLNTIKSVPT